MRDSVYEEVYHLETRHWWFRARRRIALSLLERFLGGGPRSGEAVRVCDIGCGCGMMLCELKAHRYDAVGVDPSDKAVGYCLSRGVTAWKGSLPDDVRLPRQDFDAVLLLDVLEHIDDDRAACVAALAMLKPGGILICTVPAHPWLWTRRDEVCHHRRRYRLRELCTLLGSFPGSRLHVLSYMNTVLFPLALLVRTLSRLTGSRTGEAGLRVPAFGLNRLFEALFALERLPLAWGVPLPFGLSLLGVVRKTS